MTFKLLALCVVCVAVVSMTAGAARAADNPVVLVDTTLGSFKVELFEDKAPITVKNFLGYVDDKFYDGTIFHRVIGKPANAKDFMLQAGGYEPGQKLKRTKAQIKNEASNGLTNTRGTLAMARTGMVDSATSQFFINLADNDFLNHRGTDPRSFGYCVFGRVIEGMDVIDKIKAVEVGPNDNGEMAVPKTDVVIKSVTRVKK